MDPLSEVLIVNLPVEAKRRLRIEAAQRNTTMSQLVRQLIEGVPATVGRAATDDVVSQEKPDPGSAST